MTNCVVIYTTPGDTDWMFFSCAADSLDHAVEQFEDAHPGQTIVRVLVNTKE